MLGLDRPGLIRHDDMINSVQTICGQRLYMAQVDTEGWILLRALPVMAVATMMAAKQVGEPKAHLTQ